MTKIVEIENIKNTRWSGSEFIAQMTKECQMFLFSYSPVYDCLLSWSDNAADILGMKDEELALHGNVFLRHITEEDRYRFLDQLEKAFIDHNLFTCQYSWIRPDNNNKIKLLCRGKLFVNKDNKKEQLFDGFIVDLGTT